jgi:ATP-dependent RNA helicase HelY
LRGRLRRHPCHECEQREEHARAAERRLRLERDTEALRARADNRTGSLARTFDRVVALLTARGYLTGEGQVTGAGRILSRVWAESDLLVAECLRRGLWERLDPAQLAASVSVTVYQSRRDWEEPVTVPRGAVADAIEQTSKVWDELAADEADRGLSLTREPDTGFVWPVFRWARGEPLAEVLASGGFDGDLPAGDFVRWARQVVDLLAQLADAAGVPGPVRHAARQAVGLVSRGVVADTGVR